MRKAFRNTHTIRLIKVGIVMVDLVFLNLLLGMFLYFSPSFLPSGAHQLSEFVFMMNVVYVACVSVREPILQMRKVCMSLIAGRMVTLVMVFTVLFTLSVLFVFGNYFNWRTAALFYLCAYVALICSRVLSKTFINWARSRGRNTCNVFYVGSTGNMEDLYNEMMGDPSTGFRVRGYFDDAPNPSLHLPIPYLGTIDSVEHYLNANPVAANSRVYCCLSSSRSSEIRHIIQYCENHLIRFCSVPSVRNYLRRPMCVEMLGDVPVLYLREEPLRDPFNRFMKRCFDILFSLLFLCTLFPLVYVIVGIITKITSPGPIFFKQKRNGLNGKEFYCYKFRSMKVNAQSDTLQATANDPRKTKFGDFLRRSSVDELPQFINVLKGDMSVVGPRPHMLKHTEEYSSLINCYMVRHFIKPGITGWAQVCGCRGETKELADMEARIHKDIWYVEHWTFLLDIRIIFMTMFSVIGGDEKAY